MLKQLNYLSLSAKRPKTVHRIRNAMAPVSASWSADRAAQRIVVCWYHLYLPHAAGLILCLMSIMGWEIFEVLTWHMSNVMDENFYIEVSREALVKFKHPETSNIDHGSHFISSRFISLRAGLTRWIAFYDFNTPHKPASYPINRDRLTMATATPAITFCLATEDTRTGFLTSSSDSKKKFHEVLAP